MKVNASGSFEVIYSVVDHPFLGVLIEAYVIQITSAGNLSLVQQRIHSKNADYYDKKLDDSDYEAIRLLDECTPEHIVKTFSSKQKIRPKEYFQKHFTKEEFKKGIRPYIERRISKVIQLIWGRNLYISELKNAAYQQISWATEESSVLFHLRRNDDNTHYFVTIKYKNHRVHLSPNATKLLSKTPCFLIAGTELLYFDKKLDGSKIEPFLRKKFVSIPRSSEEVYFKKFVIPLIENYSVYAKGLEIISERHVASPVLRITELLDGSFGVLLLFKYGNSVFEYHSSKYVSVSLEKSGDSYTFKRIKRSKNWENIKRDTLLLMGLEHKVGSAFGLPDAVDDYEIVEWATLNSDSIQKAGFTVEQDLGDEYAMELAEMNLVLHEEKDWFDVKTEILLGGFSIPIAKLRGHILKGNRTYTLPDGRLAIIPLKWLEQLKGLVEFSVDEENLHIEKKHLGLVQAVFHKPDRPEMYQDILGFDGIPDAPLPKGFLGELRPYQKAGYDWMHFLKSLNMGGVLADDMGLGKTVQALAFLQYLKENPWDSLQKPEKDNQANLFGASKKAQTNLLIVPTSLIYNWVLESKRFTPEMDIYKHIGIGRDSSASSFSNYDLIVTTYGTARNDIDLFKSFEFGLVLLDESQFIKNPTSKVAKNIAQINAKLKITLTGTPIENTVVDLWSQMNFVNPGMLGTHKSFVTKFANPIEKQHDPDKTTQLHTLIKPFVMRRNKMQVAQDLPPKMEQIIHCEMTDEQNDIYEKTKSTYRNLILDSIQKVGMNKSRIHLLSGLTKLRQIANHPILCDAEYEYGSGKFNHVRAMLETALEENHKVLMFSQFVGHLTLYSNLLRELNIDFSYLDGSVPSKQRQEEVRMFQQENTSRQVFLISLKAGGFGLNLTAADYVFMLDPWWNPAAEAQAIDRTHRIGQTQNVFSYKFVTGDTVEDKIVQLQNEKKQISEALIKTEESYVKKLTIDDIESIFS
jgi:superfamily II DNA or RNA helicase